MTRMSSAIATIFLAVLCVRAQAHAAPAKDLPARPPMVKGQISVFGTARPSREQKQLAQHVGYLLAQRGYAVLNGGFSGVMEHVSRGARRGGGLVIAITPGNRTGEANRYVDIEIPTGLKELRNTVLAAAGDGAIAIGSTPGTTSEVAWALRQGKIVVAPRGHVQRLAGVKLVPVAPKGGRRLLAAATAMVDEVVGRVEAARAAREKALKEKLLREARRAARLAAKNVRSGQPAGR